MIDFRDRSNDLERMDAPSIPEPELQLALAELESINQNLDGYAPSIDAMKMLLPPGTRQATLLDVGTGGGDVAVALAEWAKTAHIALAITAIDIDPVTVAYARERCREHDAITLLEQDLHGLAAELRFDVVHSSLVLHHFPGVAAADALRAMYAHARLGVVVNDLHRHPVAYHAIRALTWLFAKSPMIRHDAPLSVLRAFTRNELLELAALAGVPEPRLLWRWAFRWQMVIAR